MEYIIELSEAQRNELLLLIKQEISNIQKDLNHQIRMPTLSALLTPKLNALKSLEARLDTPIQGAAFVANFAKNVSKLQPNLN
jgi:hypothetical protein